MLGGVGSIVVDERQETGFHNPTTLRAKDHPNLPGKARTNAKQAIEPAFSISSLFVFFLLNRSQNGFGVALLFKLARRMNCHLGAVSRSQGRDPRHGLPAKIHEDRIGVA